MKIIYKLFILILIFINIPLLIFIGLTIFLTSGLPVVFRQKRTGKNGKTFMMYKFRTMVKDAEKLRKKYEKLDEADGPVFKIRNDPRFTPFGKFLSHTGLDELPQLVNVFKGDMGLIGPRPLPVEESNKLKTWQKKRHMIKPGIISPWILNGYHSQSFEAWMKSDIEYAGSKNFGSDTRLSLKAASFLIRLFINEIGSF